MRNDLLFIDGELVDLDDDTKITLSYKSNIFTDISKIVSNNSYTIKLPKTIRNQRIIKHADLPACNTDYPREKHNGRYIRNGVEIISTSMAVLISITDTIDIALAWGNTTAFGTVISEGKKLTELPHRNDYWEWKNWGKNDNKVYPRIDYGFKQEETKVWYHPVCFVSDILNKITSAYHVNFIFPDDKKNQIEKMFIPLLTRNESKEYSDECAISLEIDGTQYDETVKRYSLIFKTNTTSNYYGRADTLGAGNRNTNSYCSFISNGTPRISGRIEVIIKADSTPSAPTFVVYNSNQSGSGANIDTSTVLEIDAINISLVGGSSDNYKVLFDFEEEKTSVLKNVFDNKRGKYIKFSFGNIGENGSVVSVSGSIKVANIAEEVILQTYLGSGWAGDEYVDGKFWIVPNLPDIKIIDFIKTIASILGVFAVPTNDANIRFVSIEELIKNKLKAKDWTRKVIASFKENKPSGISFSLDGFAQKNLYSWKDENTVLGEYDGYIYVDDQTIEVEKEAITLPFAPSEMYNGVAKIPLYSYDKDGNLQYDKVDPRLLVLSGINGSFNGLDWNSLLQRNYVKYQEAVRRPVIITEKIEISDFDLKELDVTVPVYLGQYGRYYAIISVKAEDTGICECKLLQLEV